MGMFDKDKEIGLLLQEYMSVGEEFILWSAKILREDFPTKFGVQPQGGLSVSKIATPGNRFDVTTVASAITAKIRDAEPGDFPAIVMLNRAISKTYGGEALVLQFLKPHGSGLGAEPGRRAQGFVGVDGEPLT